MSDSLTSTWSFQCPVCRCHQFARVDEPKTGGGFEKRFVIRCVECKHDYDTLAAFNGLQSTLAALAAKTAELESERAARQSAEARVAELEKVLEPFAAVAGPIKGEAGRPTYLDTIIQSGQTEELAVTTIFDTGGRGAVLWADNFRSARAALNKERERS